MDFGQLIAEVARRGHSESRDQCRGGDAAVALERGEDLDTVRPVLGRLVDTEVVRRIGDDFEVKDGGS